MLENAIVARARAWLLPDDHPVSPLMAQACMLPCLTWAASVSAAMQAPDLPENIPEILNCGACTPAERTQAKSDSDVRKIILKRYRWEVVRSCLLEYDRRVYLQAAEKFLDALQVSVGALQPTPERLDVGLMDVAWSSQSWKWFRCWSIVRITGRWLLTAYGEHELPSELPACRACGAARVSVAHAMAECPASEASYQALAGMSDLPQRECTPAFFRSLLYLGKGSEGSAHLVDRIRFVGTAINASCSSGTVGEFPDGVSEETPIDDERLDQLIRIVRDHNDDMEGDNLLDLEETV